MKRRIFFVFICFICLGIFLGISCENDFISSTKQINDFKKDLVAFEQAKTELLNGLLTRSMSNNISLEELKHVGEKIDNLTFEFLTKHEDILSSYKLKPLSEDSLSILLVDEEAMLKYIEKNFSETFFSAFNIFMKSIDNNASTRSSNLSYDVDLLNPLEQVLVSEMETAQQFKDLLPINSREVVYKSADKEKAIQECNLMHRRSVTKCNICYFGSVVISFAGASVGGGAVVAIGVVWAAGWYIDCMVSAENSHKQCINRIK